MPFGLKNVGATFQWTMNIAFFNEKDAFLVVYLDDLMVFFGFDDEHLYHLRIVFQKYRKFGIYFNPKKSLFSMDEGKLLGHIIYKHGIHVDPSRVEEIHHIEFSCNKKEIQAFNGKMNLLRRFIPNLAEHLREITNMFKKDSVVKWTEDAMKSFNLVKFALTIALVLISPNYIHDFIIFSFASEHTMAMVLMQKRDQVEQPISFFSRTIRDTALHYDIIEKQVLALIKALKDFRVDIMHSHTIAYVPNVAIKDVLMKTDLEGRRGKWIAAMLEYDLEIKPTKLIKGQGLGKLMVESNLHALDINLIAAMSEDESGSLIQVSKMFLKSPWYSNIVYVLQHLLPPPGMSISKGRSLKLKFEKFYISAFYWKDPGGFLLNCLVEDEAQQVMNDLHTGDCGSHLFWKTTTNKVLRERYYWPTLFLDLYKTMMGCHECQVFQGKRNLIPLPLKPVEVNAPFQLWGINFIGEIYPTSSTQHRWILIATDYFTNWIEGIPTRQATDMVIIQFLESNIFSRFGCPHKIITDNVAELKSKKMVDFCNKY